MRARPAFLALLSAATLGVLTLAALPGTVQAQGQSNPIIASLEFRQTDVREALRKLFQNVGVSYTIASEVQGTVTVSLKNVPFETALQNIARQVEATYRIEGGVYQIVPREMPGGFGVEGPLPPSAQGVSGNERAMSKTAASSTCWTTGTWSRSTRRR